MAAKPDDELDRGQLIGGLRRWRTRARQLAEEKRRLRDENVTWQARAAVLESRVVELKAELASSNHSREVTKMAVAH